MAASCSRRSTPDLFFSTEVRPATPDRKVIISGDVGADFEIAVGYADVCSNHNCCPAGTFMRYEKLKFLHGYHEYFLTVPLKSKYGNHIREVAIQTKAPFWEFYIPIDRLQRDEPNHVEIVNQQLILLKNSSGVQAIVRGR